MVDLGTPSKQFKIGNIFCLFRTRKSFWFRIFNGYGLWGRKIEKGMWIPFSERMGYTKTLKVFGWKFKILHPSKK